jgi:5-formyltetrahydrofolate cyclo-ligase
LLAGRAEVPAPVRTAEAAALAGAVTTVVSTLSGPGDHTVCAYVPVGREPGSVQLLDLLASAGHQVLLPVVTPDTPLDWAEYQGANDLVPGPFRLRQPAGDRLGVAAIGAAAVVLVPALAVDRRGVRLGRGAGYYDRALPLAAPTAALVAVVRDTEVVPELPAEPHDVRMTAALTPVGGLITLPITGH